MLALSSEQVALPGEGTCGIFESVKTAISLIAKTQLKLTRDEANDLDPVFGHFDPEGVRPGRDRGFGSRVRGHPGQRLTGAMTSHDDYPALGRSDQGHQLLGDFHCSEEIDFDLKSSLFFGLPFELSEYHDPGVVHEGANHCEIIIEYDLHIIFRRSLYLVYLDSPEP